jgi:ketosteroid isomerase-like protein
MRRSILALASVLAVAAAAGWTPAFAAEDVAQKIVAMERAALDRSDAGDVEGFLEISAPDVIYLDPSLEKPINGLAELTAYYRAGIPYEPGSGEMSNVHVQVMDGAAVLTFNYLSRKKANGAVTHWNATEVYRREGGAWRIVNTHWSYTKSQPIDQAK